MNISEEALEFLREQYRDSLANWLDDPDEQFTAWTHAEFLEWYEKMIRIGKEVGFEFWTVAAEEATEYEINRAKKMLNEALQVVLK